MNANPLSISIVSKFWRALVFESTSETPQILLPLSYLLFLLQALILYSPLSNPAV
jgi:hypothetical protein